MAVYQIRLPNHHNLESWLDEINWLLWYALTHHPELKEITPHAFVMMRQIVRETLERHLSEYSGCGLWEVCRVETTAGPWMRSEGYRPDDTGVRWYILEIDGRIDELVAEVTDQVQQLLTSLLQVTITRQELWGDVEGALQKGIGPYLWQNPCCRVHPLCYGSLRCNPWNEVRR